MHNPNPLGWVLVKRNGELVPWHDRIYPRDPSGRYGNANIVSVADRISPEDGPHRWQCVVSYGAPQPADGVDVPLKGQQ